MPQRAEVDHVFDRKTFYSQRGNFPCLNAAINSMSESDPSLFKSVFKSKFSDRVIRHVYDHIGDNGLRDEDLWRLKTLIFEYLSFVFCVNNSKHIKPLDYRDQGDLRGYNFLTTPEETEVLYFLRMINSVSLDNLLANYPLAAADGLEYISRLDSNLEYGMNYVKDFVATWGVIGRSVPDFLIFSKCGNSSSVSLMLYGVIDAKFGYGKTKVEIQAKKFSPELTGNNLDIDGADMAHFINLVCSRRGNFRCNKVNVAGRLLKMVTTPRGNYMRGVKGVDRIMRVPVDRQDIGTVSESLVADILAIENEKALYSNELSS